MLISDVLEQKPKTLHDLHIDVLRYMCIHKCLDLSRNIQIPSLNIQIDIIHIPYHIVYSELFRKSNLHDKIK